MNWFSRLKVVRLPLSSFAAVVAASICGLQHHVHVVLADPRTYSSPFHHKCGLLMMGCMLWAVTEVVLWHGHGEMPQLRGHTHG